MAFIADILLLLAAVTAAFYCQVLASRLKRLGATDQGLGGAISALSLQVDHLQAALNSVQNQIHKREESLLLATLKADAAARKLELLLAALHEDTANPPVKKAAMDKDILRLSSEDKVRPDPAAQTKSRSIARSLSRRILHGTNGS